MFVEKVKEVQYNNRLRLKSLEMNISAKCEQPLSTRLEKVRENWDLLDERKLLPNEFVIRCANVPCTDDIWDDKEKSSSTASTDDDADEESSLINDVGTCLFYRKF